MKEEILIQHLVENLKEMNLVSHDFGPSKSFKDLERELLGRGQHEPEGEKTSPGTPSPPQTPARGSDPQSQVKALVQHLLTDLDQGNKQRALTRLRQLEQMVSQMS